MDTARDVALVALSRHEASTAIVAEARYSLAQEDDNAEFAIAVADEFQRRGLGRYLVKRLLATAWQRGVGRLFGQIKSDNRGMLALAMQLGFRLRSSVEDEGVVIASSIAPSPAQRKAPEADGAPLMLHASGPAVLNWASSQQ